MNKIIIESSKETILDDDAQNFYELISKITGRKLDKIKNALFLSKPEKPSQNSREHMIYCILDNIQRIAFKRCMDNSEFLRREKLVSKAKTLVGLPTYNLIEIRGIILRVKIDDKTNCSILRGWEDKVFLGIDYGNIHNLKPLSEVPNNSIHKETFFYQFGQWLAFNLLFGVQDRHRNNFVYSVDGVLHSVDNEFGPFDSSGRLFSVKKLATQMKQVYLPYTDEIAIPMQKEHLKNGFIDCWDKIAANLSNFPDLTKRECDLLQNSIGYDSSKVFEQLFA